MAADLGLLLVSDHTIQDTVDGNAGAIENLDLVMLERTPVSKTSGVDYQPHVFKSPSTTPKSKVFSYPFLHAHFRY